MPRWTAAEYDEWQRRKRNPSVGPVEASQPKPAPAPALDGQHPKRQRRQKGVAACCRVVLVAALRRELDTDNLQGSLKPLRDQIAQWLGVDDADSRVTWEYGQVLIKGKPGVIVRIEQV